MLMDPGGTGASHDFLLREMAQNHSFSYVNVHRIIHSPIRMWLVCAKHCAGFRDTEVLKAWAGTAVGGSHN